MRQRVDRLRRAAAVAREAEAAHSRRVWHAHRHEVRVIDPLHQGRRPAGETDTAFAIARLGLEPGVDPCDLHDLEARRSQLLDRLGGRPVHAAPVERAACARKHHHQATGRARRLGNGQGHRSRAGEGSALHRGPRADVSCRTGAAGPRRRRNDAAKRQCGVGCAGHLLPGGERTQRDCNSRGPDQPLLHLEPPRGPRNLSIHPHSCESQGC